MSRRTPIAFAGIVLVASLLAATAYRFRQDARTILEIGESTRVVNAILVDLEKLRSQSATADLYQRLYSSSRNSIYETKFRDAATRVDETLKHLGEITDEEPGRTARVTDLREAVGQRMAIYRENVERRRANLTETSVPIVRSFSVVERTVSQMEAAFSSISAAEAGYLNSRMAESQSAISRASAMFAASSALAVTSLVALGLAVRRPSTSRGETLRRREDWLDVTLQSVGDALIATDAEGRVLLTNPAAEALTGWSSEEARGRPLVEVFKILDETTRRRLESPVVDVFRRNEVSELDNHTLLIARDGTETPIEETASPIRGERGEVEGAVLVFRGVADRKRNEAERERLLAEAESANRAKDRFLAVLSHELRTPLNPVLLATTALLDGTLPPDETRSTLAMIRRNIEIEARLIDDLLDLTRIVQGKLTLRIEGTDVHGSILEAAETCRGDLDSAGIRFSIDLGATRHLVQGDPARLQQVVWNLIKNAVKFTPRGGSIEVRSRNDRELLVVEVEDSGIGMEPEILGRIFEPFQQGDLPAARWSGGLGLGLAISRSVILAHGGSVIALSPGKGRGSTFRVELPVASVPIAPRGVESMLSAPPRSESLRILLVEDDETTLNLMARLLGRLGHSITKASTLRAALIAFEEGEFDLLISDLGLPDGTGLDLLRQIGPLRAIPSIALTGHGMEEAVRSSLDAGFSIHLTKPIDFKNLKDAIASLTSDER